MTQNITPAIGMVWYLAENYDACRRIMADGDQLPNTFDEWRMKTEAKEEEYRSEGHVIVRAYIDPETFPDWCRARALKVEAKARMLFASSVAKEHDGSRH